MKRTKLKKQSNTKISTLKRALWKVFSQFIRTRDQGVCFVCGRRASGQGYQAGHFIPKSVGGLTLYFHEDNVHGCCYNCNINLGGNLWEYGKKLGEKRVAELYKLKGKTLKVSPEWYEEKIEYYKSRLNGL